jgi:predicted  nucleic acid-binding Zn-ribbon protein
MSDLIIIYTIIQNNITKQTNKLQNKMQRTTNQKNSFYGMNLPGQNAPNQLRLSQSMNGKHAPFELKSEFNSSLDYIVPLNQLDQSITSPPRCKASSRRNVTFKKDSDTNLKLGMRQTSYSDLVSTNKAGLSSTNGETMYTGPPRMETVGENEFNSSSTDNMSARMMPPLSVDASNSIVQLSQGTSSEDPNREIRKLPSQLQNRNQANLKQQQSILSYAETKIPNLEQRLNQKENELSSANETIRNLEQRLSDKNNELSRLSNVETLLSEKENELSSTNETIGFLKNELETSCDLIDNLKESSRQKDNELSSLNETIGNLQQRLNANDLPDKLNQAEQKIIELKTELYTLGTHLHPALTRISEIYNGISVKEEPNIVTSGTSVNEDGKKSSTE